MKKIAIIGASYLQVPLIYKAKEMGFETHVFAWKTNDIGEKVADFFYPISIVDKDEILKKCTEIGICGVCSIASDLASITVNYVANNMNLIGNSEKCSFISTNKHAMRETFESKGIPSPKSILVSTADDLQDIDIEYPAIVKPTDRSGCRGITGVNNKQELYKAFEKARNESFEKRVLIEEYIFGDEYSIECISSNGEHQFIASTKKYTTGNPYYVETGHLQPGIENKLLNQSVKEVVFSTLNAVGFKNGASHTELKINDKGIFVIEVGCRMGGDMIGSSLVQLSTGYDFVRNVINVCTGTEFEAFSNMHKGYSGIKYIINRHDFSTFCKIQSDNPQIIVEHSINDITTDIVDESSKRFGYYVIFSNNKQDLIEILESSNYYISN